MYQRYTTVNAKTVQILLKLVVKLYWGNVGGQMADKKTKPSFLSERKYYKYRSYLKLLLRQEYKHIS